MAPARRTISDPKKIHFLSRQMVKKPVRGAIPEGYEPGNVVWAETQLSAKQPLK